MPKVLEGPLRRSRAEGAEQPRPGFDEDYPQRGTGSDHFIGHHGQCPRRLDPGGASTHDHGCDLQVGQWSSRRHRFEDSEQVDPQRDRVAEGVGGPGVFGHARDVEEVGLRAGGENQVIEVQTWAVLQPQPLVCSVNRYRDAHPDGQVGLAAEHLAKRHAHLLERQVPVLTWYGSGWNVW